MNTSHLTIALEKIFTEAFSFSTKQTTVMIDAIFFRAISDIVIIFTHSSDENKEQLQNIFHQQTSPEQTLEAVLQYAQTEETLQKSIKNYLVSTLPQHILEILGQGLKTMSSQKKEEVISQIISALEEIDT